jgi:predicted phage tail protein
MAATTRSMPFWNFLMTALGLSMIVGGMAFLLSGLIFLLPSGQRQSKRDQSFEQARNEIEFYLSQMRKKSE